MQPSAGRRRSVTPGLGLTVVAILIALAVSLAAASPCRSAPPKAWTVLLYLDGENLDMQHDILAEFDNMIAADVGSDDAVNVVAQLDRIAGSDKYGGWTEANRFYVTPGMEPTQGNAVADWGDGRGGREVDMEFDRWVEDNAQGPSYDPDLWRLAWDEGRLVGALTAVVREQTGWDRSLQERGHERREAIRRVGAHAGSKLATHEGDAGRRRGR